MMSSSAMASAFLTRETLLRDYFIANESRHASYMGRREALSGNAKFGIFGDGKEVPQLAMAKVFQKGDFRSGYYRDQTFMLAIGEITVQQMFAQLYAHADVRYEPATAGRTMNSHFATRSLDEYGQWKNLSEMYNSAADISPTASQMPRLVGLAYASRLYREIEDLRHFTQFSKGGNEVAFGTIGNASCAEGMFWEAINAIGVLKAPAVISIWDDGYGISVPNKYQMTKENMYALLQGFQREEGSDVGFDIYQVKGWDYPALLEVYIEAANNARFYHIPSIIHVVDLTQPQGHSTSGSHERYKPKERLEWEREYDCIVKMREWLIAEKFASPQELDEIEAQAKQSVENARRQAFEAYMQPIRQEVGEALELMRRIALSASSECAHEIQRISHELSTLRNPERRDIVSAVCWTLFAVRNEPIPAKQDLITWIHQQNAINRERYSSNLYSESKESALKVPVIPAVYAPDAPNVNGFEILNACFDAALKRDPRVLAFGEDVGHLGDVNQAFAGLQKKYGELRVSDTGIRECTIVGQGIGLAMRGLRPIAEIQYLDYLLYAIQIMSDDLASLQYRTKGGQKAPLIIRTRGHRLEGVWHSGSPMSGIINFVRGIHVLVPRNMTQAAGFYNTLLRSDDPALVIEVLNGYRLKEKMPANIGEFTVPLGVPEVLRSGTDITIVSYGATLRLVLKAAELLASAGINAEVIDVQSLLPFDRFGVIVSSLQKTNRILFVDEDVPGGCTAYMMQQVIEKQGGYQYLDAQPRTLTGQEHRPAYGTDGNFWSKPDVEHIFMAAYEMMHEAYPKKYPMFY
ncbi:MAG: thiamine pyrophosphate-dependent enzyme [Bacteroidota bacterium]|nr:thiamine pyrophosphate-dependent enzyme [Candidatus Kapabacteria bacterium]MDW8219417.1 thiamine pyrophosphate-dependent enzyme [Bacteroidota bacterium]